MHFSCMTVALRWMQYIHAAELLNERERRTEVSHEAFIMHSHNCSVTVFMIVVCFIINVATCCCRDL